MWADAEGPALLCGAPAHPGPEISARDQRTLPLWKVIPVLSPYHAACWGVASAYATMESTGQGAQVLRLDTGVAEDLQYSMSEIRCRYSKFFCDLEIWATIKILPNIGLWKVKENCGRVSSVQPCLA